MQARADAPKDLFDRIDLKTVKNELIGKAFEGNWLDCKQKSDPKTHELNNDDRKNFAKELTAFANTDGGILLWGLDARQIEGVDCIQKIVPISHLAKFESRLRQLQPQMSEPPIPGVEFKSIETGPDCGMVIVWVPPSDVTLHRSTQDLKFYSRSGSSSFGLPMSQVTPLLTGKTRPRLEMFVEPLGGMKGVIGLRNVGHSTAHDPYFAVNLPNMLVASDNELNGNDPLRSCVQADTYGGKGGRWVLFSASHPIHPGAEIRVVRVNGHPQWQFGSGNEMAFEYRIYASGMPEVSGAFIYKWR